MKDKRDIERRIDHLYDDLDERSPDPVVRAKVEALDFLLGDHDPICEAVLEAPTDDAGIAALIAALNDEKTTVPEYSAFGDPNWRITEGMVEILEWAKGE